MYDFSNVYLYLCIRVGGWIHAVYTPEDSLVFGGNFLHCFAMLRQLQADSIERRTRVAQQYRFPHFQRIHWYSIVSLLPYALQRVLNRSVDELRSESVAVLRELDSNSRLTAIVNHCIAEDYFEDCTLRICDALLDTVVIRQLPYVLRAMEGWLHGGSISSAAHNISIVESHSVHEDVYLYAHVVLQMDVESEPNCLSNLLDIWWRVLDTIAMDDVQGNSNSHLVGLREHISFVRGLTLEQCDWLDPSVVAGGLFSDNQLSNIAIENAVEPMVKEESLVYDKTQHGHTESVSSIAPSSSPTASLPPRPLKLKLVLRPPVDPSSAPQNSINNLTTTADHPFTDTAHTDNLPLKRKKTCTIKQSVEFADLVTQADSFTLDNSDKVNNESSIIAATAEAVVSAVKLPVLSPSPASAVLVKDEVESEGRYKTRGHRVSAEFIQHATDIDIVAFATDLSMHTHDLGAAHVDSSSRVGSRHDLATFKGEGEDAMKEDEDLMVEDEEDDMDNDSAFDSEYSDEEYTKVKRRKPSNKQPTAPLVSKSSAAIIGSAKKETVVKKNSSSKSGNNNSARQNILKKLGMRR